MGVWPIPHRPPLTATPTSGQNHPHQYHLSSPARPLTLLQPTRPLYPPARSMQPHHNRPSTHQRKCASQPARQHPSVQTTSESPYPSVSRHQTATDGILPQCPGANTHPSHTSSCTNADLSSFLAKPTVKPDLMGPKLP